MKITPKSTVISKVHADCTSHSQTDISVRDVGSTIDEPLERGGTNLGPAPTETMLSALAACTNVISNKCAKNLGIEFEAVSIDVEAAFDNRGVRLLEEVDIPFPTIKLFINVRTPASEAEMAQLKADLNKYCPISKIIRGAGTEIEEIWTVERP